jgi:hypothetical protein
MEEIRNNILQVQTDIINIPIQNGFSPSRWQTVVNAMLEKNLREASAAQTKGHSHSRSGLQSGPETDIWKTITTELRNSWIPRQYSRWI